MICLNRCATASPNQMESELLRRGIGVSKRCLVEESFDRFSSLPVSVLQHILSFLPIKDAVKTSVLSKTWQFIWTSVSSLAFSSPLRANFSATHFAHVVNKVLLQHDCGKIQKLLIKTPFRKCLQSQLDNLVKFAIRCKVEELDLDFNDDMTTRKFDIVEEMTTMTKYVLSCSFYKHSSLAKLSIKCCLIILPLPGVYWPSLKDLSIKNAYLSGGEVATILAGCHSLERLKLIDCVGIQDLDVHCLSLKEFTYENIATVPSVMKVWTPNLVSLSLYHWACYYHLEYKLMDVSSLVEVELDITYVNLQGRWLYLQKKLRELFQQLHKLQKFTLDQAEEDATCNKENLEPNIVHEMKAFWRQENNFNCLQSTLKKVYITGFQPSKKRWDFAETLVEFLLNNALVLEKMVICTREHSFYQSWKNGAYRSWSQVGSEELWKLLDATLRIHGYERASPKAKVVLESYII